MAAFTHHLLNPPAPATPAQPPQRGQRRLRVSALATVANPSVQRVDTWHLLDDAAQQLAVVHQAGLPCRQEVNLVRRLLDRLAAYERYWLYPGPDVLAELGAHLDNLRTAQLLEELGIATRLLSEFGDQAAMFDRMRPLPDPELTARAGRLQFCTVLLADHSREVAGIDELAPLLRSLRLPYDDVQIEFLVVGSVEDAITAVTLNGDIQTAIIRHDLPLRSADRLPLMTRLLGVDRHPEATDRTFEATECGQWIRELRPHIDL